MQMGELPELSEGDPHSEDFYSELRSSLPMSQGFIYCYSRGAHTCQKPELHGPMNHVHYSVTSGESPCRKVKKPRQDNRQMRFLTPEEVQLLHMGHMAIEMTMRHSHLAPDSLRSAAMGLAQKGIRHNKIKPFKLENESGVFEIVENYDGNTYRAIYTARYAEAIYIIHCFQKKSPHGIKTSLQDVNLIRERLRRLRIIIGEEIKNG